MKLKDLKKLKAEIDEVVALHENLKNVQGRCTELLQETRAQRKVIADLKKRIEELETLRELQDPEPDPYNGLPDLSPMVDLFDTEAVLDGSRPAEVDPPKRETLEDVAKRLGQKCTEVLMKLLVRGDKGVHIHSELDPETVAWLESEFKADTPANKKPWPSPHQQPPFQPRGFDRGMVLDGAGQHMRRGRGPTFD